MAEAHQAVSYSKLVDRNRNGHHKSNDKENDAMQCDQQIHSPTKRSSRKMSRFTMRLRNTVYPVHLESFWVIFVLVMCVHFAGKTVPFDLANTVNGLILR